MFLLALRGKNMVTDPPHSPCSRLYEALSGESHGPTNHPDSSCFQCFNSVTTNHFGSKKNALLSWQFPRNTPPINHYYWFEVIYIYIWICVYMYVRVFPWKVPFLVPLSIPTLHHSTWKVRDLEEPQVAKQVQHPLAVPLGPGCGISSFFLRSDFQLSQVQR